MTAAGLGDGHVGLAPPRRKRAAPSSDAIDRRSGSSAISGDDQRRAATAYARGVLRATAGEALANGARHAPARADDDPSGADAASSSPPPSALPLSRRHEARLREMSVADVASDAFDPDELFATQRVFFSMNAREALKNGDVDQVPDVQSRFAHVVERFPKLREALLRSPSAMRLIATPGALRAFLDAATGAGRGVDELFLNADYRDIIASAARDDSAQTNATVADALARLADVRDELERFSFSDGWTPGCKPLPKEPDDWDGEVFLAARKNEDAADARCGNAYMRAYGREADWAAPFAVLLFGAAAASIFPAFVWFPAWLVVGSFGIGLAREAAKLETARKGQLSLSSAACVHALMLVCGLQFFIVYCPEFWPTWRHRAWLALGAASFVTTPYFFLRTYFVGPGFLPKAADAADRGVWTGILMRVANAIRREKGIDRSSDAERAKNQNPGGGSEDAAANRSGSDAPAAAAAARRDATTVTSMISDGRFCQTCHCARPLRSKHCSLCGRCVHRMDHHCPIAGTCVGVANQRHFAFGLWDMLLGQGVFLAFSWLHVAAVFVTAGESVTGGGHHRMVERDLDDLGASAASYSSGGEAGGGGAFTLSSTTAPPGVVRKLFAVFRHAPWALTLALIQCVCVLYCALIAARMTAGIAFNLTVNEMENSWRYSYLQSEEEEAAVAGEGARSRRAPPGFRNRFDRGVANNCLEFWRGHQARVDWDAQKVAVDLGEVPGPPRWSYSWIQAARGGARRIPRWFREAIRVHAPARADEDHEEGHQHAHGHRGGHRGHLRGHSSHGHSHDGKPCDGDHSVFSQQNLDPGDVELGLAGARRSRVGVSVVPERDPAPAAPIAANGDLVERAQTASTTGVEPSRRPSTGLRPALDRSSAPPSGAAAPPGAPWGENGRTFLEVKAETEAAMAGLVAEEAKARGTTREALEAEWEAERRAALEKHAAERGVDPDALVKQGDELLERKAAASGMTVEQFKVIQDYARLREIEAERRVEARRAEFAAARENAEAKAAGDGGEGRREGGEGGEDGGDDDVFASLPDDLSALTAEEAKAKAEAVTRKMTAAQAAKMALTVDEFEEMGKRQKAAMLRRAAEQRGMTPEAFERAAEAQMERTAKANGMDLEEFKARMTLQQMQQQRAMMREMQRRQMVMAEMKAREERERTAAANGKAE